MTLLTVNRDIRRLERIKVKPFFPPPNQSFETKWEITIHSTKQEPLLWKNHKRASDNFFLQKGLSSVGEKRGVDISRYPTFFAEARIKTAGGDKRLVGGIRMQLSDNNGKLSMINELDGYTNTKNLSNFLKQFRPKNVAYGSGLWIAPKYNFPGLSADLARAYFLLVYISKAQWHTACVPHHILNAWTSLGWPVLPNISSFFYPDERYKSFILFGSKDAWPGLLLDWAEEQSIGFSLNNLSQKKLVSPMRIIK